MLEKITRANRTLHITTTLAISDGPFIARQTAEQHVKNADCVAWVWHAGKHATLKIGVVEGRVAAGQSPLDVAEELIKAGVLAPSVILSQIAKCGKPYCHEGSRLIVRVPRLRTDAKQSRDTLYCPRNDVLRRLPKGFEPDLIGGYYRDLAASAKVGEINKAAGFELSAGALAPIRQTMNTLVSGTPAAQPVSDKVFNVLMDKPKPPFVCMDCAFHNAAPIPDPLPDDYICPHWDPGEYVKQGWVRHWGDAAVSAFPLMEILRKREERGGTTEIKYLILAPAFLRRPVEIYAESDGSLRSWGSY